MPRKQWPLEVHGIDTILEDGIEVKDLDVKDILLEGLITLKKIELHLQILSNEEIKNYDVGG